MTPPRNEFEGRPWAVPLGHVDQWESTAVDYVDGRLTPSALAAVEAHLSGCSACREALAEQERVAARLQAAEPVAVPAFLESQVLDWGVLDALLPAPKPIRRRASQATPVGSFLGGLIRRPWVPAAIAAAVVLVVLAGAGDLSRSGRQPDLAALETGSALRAQLGTAGAPSSDPAKSGPTTSAAAASSVDPSAGGNVTSVSSEVVSGDAPTPQGAPTQPSPATTGSQGPTETMVATGDTVLTAGAGGPALRDAAALPPTVWVDLEAPAGNAGAAVTIEKATGLQALPQEVSAGAPVYAALVHRSDLDAILRYLSDAGLMVALSDTSGPQFTQTLAAVAGQISALPLVKAVSPQGDALFASTASFSTDSPNDYLLMILAPAR